MSLSASLLMPIRCVDWSFVWLSSGPHRAQAAAVAPLPSAPLANGLSLPDGLAGVPRRHCTFVRDGDEPGARRSQSLRHRSSTASAFLNVCASMRAMKLGSPASSCRSLRSVPDTMAPSSPQCRDLQSVVSTDLPAASARSFCSTRSSAPRAGIARTRNNDDLTAQVSKVEEEVLIGTRNRRVCVTRSRRPRAKRLAPPRAPRKLVTDLKTQRLRDGCVRRHEGLRGASASRS